MRTLFIGVLAATLAGCASRIDSKPAVFKVHSQNERSTKSINPASRSSAQFRKKTKAVAQTAKDTVAGTTASLPRVQPNLQADPVTEKAKTSIAALLEDPASAEFSKLQRAVKKLVSKSVDTVCGHVRGKTASGEDTGNMPFLYIVDDDRAYLVDGQSHVSDAVHSIVCK